MDKRLAFLIDTRYCNNCKTCEIACKMERKLPIGVRWRVVRRQEISGIQSGMNNPHTVYNIPMSCNHCEKPACVEICPVNAYKKTPQGPVIQNQSVCIGCSKCVSACPYSAPVYNPKIMLTGKCDMCYDRIQEGLEPYCVQCCPNNALKIGYYEDFVSAYGVHQDIDVVPYTPAVPPTTPNDSGNGYSILPDPAITNPSIVIVTMKNNPN